MCVCLIYACASYTDRYVVCVARCQPTRQSIASARILFGHHISVRLVDFSIVSFVFIALFVCLSVTTTAMMMMMMMPHNRIVRAHSFTSRSFRAYIFVSMSTIASQWSYYSLYLASHTSSVWNEPPRPKCQQQPRLLHIWTDQINIQWRIINRYSNTVK